MEILRGYKSRKKGYTLIELIVVLALFSLFLTIAIPNSRAFKTFNQNQQLRMLEKDLRQARNTAIIENKVIFAEFLVSYNSYVIKYSESNKILERQFHDGVELSGTNSTTMKFNGDGRIGYAGTLRIKKGSEKYKLAVAPVTSKIKLEKDN